MAAYQWSYVKNFKILLLALKSSALDCLRSNVGIIYGRRGWIVLAITIDYTLEATYLEDFLRLRLLLHLPQILQKRFGMITRLTLPKMKYGEHNLLFSRLIHV
ncbi:MAG: hypothetical protein ABI954_15650 [Pyrinomonadaceae bacterium]